MVQGTVLLSKLSSNFLVSHMLRFLLPVSLLTSVSFHPTVMWGKKRKWVKALQKSITYLSVIIMKYKQLNLAIVLMLDLRSISSYLKKKKQNKYDHIYVSIIFSKAEAWLKGPILTCTSTYTNQEDFCWSQWKGLWQDKCESKAQAPQWVFECLPLSKKCPFSPPQIIPSVWKIHSYPAHPSFP